MLMMKACPRCSGDLTRTRDPHDDEPMFSCVQCGYSSYRPMAVRSTAEVEAKRVEVASTVHTTAASTGSLTGGVRARMAARRLAARQGVAEQAA
jgi:hypothetical protein